MENKNLLWQSSAKKAFYGYAALAICNVISSIATLVFVIGAMNGTVSGNSVISSILSVIVLISVVFYYWGIDGMKKCTSGSLIGNEVAKLSKGSLLMLISVAISLLPASFHIIRLAFIISYLTLLISIVGYCFTYKGFVNISKLPLDDEAAKGAKQLSLMSILAIIICVTGVLPIIGNIINLLLSIAILVYAFLGWSKFSLAKIDVLDNMPIDAIAMTEEAGSESQEVGADEVPEEEEDSFFLNRWTSKLAKWFDGYVFNLNSSSSALCVGALWIGILAGAAIGVVTMINDDTSFEYWAMGIAGAIILILIILQAIKDIKKLSSGGQIAGRLAYLILLPLALACIGGVLAAIAVIVVAIILFLSILLTLIFGSGDKVKLSNGDVIKDHGALGGFIGKTGNKYRKNIDGTFSHDD